MLLYKESRFPWLNIFHLSQLTGLFQFTVRLASETEARFTSVERIHHYIKVLVLHHFLTDSFSLTFDKIWRLLSFFVTNSEKKGWSSTFAYSPLSVLVSVSGGPCKGEKQGSSIWLAPGGWDSVWWNGDEVQRQPPTGTEESFLHHSTEREDRNCRTNRLRSVTSLVSFLNNYDAQFESGASFIKHMN